MARGCCGSQKRHGGVAYRKMTCVAIARASIRDFRASQRRNFEYLYEGGRVSGICCDNPCEPWKRVFSVIPRLIRWLQRIWCREVSGSNSWHPRRRMRHSPAAIVAGKGLYSRGNHFRPGSNGKCQPTSRRTDHVRFASTVLSTAIAAPQYWLGMAPFGPVRFSFARS